PRVGVRLANGPAQGPGATIVRQAGDIEGGRRDAVLQPLDARPEPRRGLPKGAGRARIKTPGPGMGGHEKTPLAVKWPAVQCLKADAVARPGARALWGQWRVVDWRYSRPGRVRHLSSENGVT